MEPNNSELDRIWCVIPVYNNGLTVKRIADECMLYLNNILVVDDGSTDSDIPNLFEGTGITVIRHGENRGKGEAIITALKYITGKGGHFMITIDGDGQHYPQDIKKFLPLLSADDPSIIIGSRNFETNNVPASSRFGRKFANFWLRIETGISIGDCQSGFRAYPVKCLSGIKTYGSHYDFEAEILARGAWAGLKLKTVPVEVWYPEPQSRVSSFKPFLDNFRISVMHARLVGKRFMRKIGGIKNAGGHSG
jgi:glycosyltransferase involved in cell wall biosynthesis